MVKFQFLGYLMIIRERIGKHLDQIKNLKGVENVVLTQRDGNPIQSSGVWFSKDEIFSVSAATSAIYNIGIHLHPKELKYILIEGKKAKILIAPLKNSYDSPLNKILEEQGIFENDDEFFIAITTLPTVNLGSIFLQTGDSLMKIKRTLITSGESFKPPLIEFNDEQIKKMMEEFDVKEDFSRDFKLSAYSLGFSEKDSYQLDEILKTFSFSIPDLKCSFVTLEGGFIASKIIKKEIFWYNPLETIAAMSFSLFQTSNRCAWLLKKMQIKTILLDCETNFQFIYGLDKGIFSSLIDKGKYKLGLLRLIIPQYANKLNQVIKKALVIEDYKKYFDIKKLLGELIIK